MKFFDNDNNAVCFYSKLVRLKVTVSDYQDLIQQFLFQIGAIKRSSSGPFLQEDMVFLFQIGAIKSDARIPIATVTESFYSKLVRLKEKCKIQDRESIAVSIPNWCD